MIVERAVVLAGEIGAIAASEVFLAQRIVDVVHEAVLHVGEAGVADAELDVGIGAGPAPFGAEAQQEVAGLHEPALGKPLGES